jgi:hypothetical protein
VHQRGPPAERADVHAAFERAPYIPAGVYVPPTAYRTHLADIRRGFPQFYGARGID